MCFQVFILSLLTLCVDCLLHQLKYDMFLLGVIPPGMLPEDGQLKIMTISKKKSLKVYFLDYFIFFYMSEMSQKKSLKHAYQSFMVIIGYVV